MTRELKKKIEKYSTADEKKKEHEKKKRENFFWIIEKNIPRPRQGHLSVADFADSELM